ncbi:MAG TPA: lysophospholipid acyltransferase family protein [Thermoclostridium sp.]|jgi:1-acyl-sn-glycerol-3-phosphate acyltransferase|nr:1-acyl-sn-glycerol-3-phosphate acyltransferase [Clostridiaceae bacterium]HOQ76784.1 lysophospholipid acyltransferase family protein [Thermoclostridium sp.]
MRIIQVLAPVISILPDRVIRYIGKRAAETLLNKYARIEVTGDEILSERIGKPTIYIANHLSNMDGIVLNKVLEKNNVIFMAGIKLKANPFTSIFLRTVRHIPINPNSADRKPIKKALEVLKTGESILIFPEGTRSRSGSMIKAKRGFLLLARLSGADIVPIALEGTERLMPINQDDMGRETPHHAAVKVKIGQPFRIEEKNPGGVSDEECLYNAMRKIAEMLDPKYQGVYGDGSPGSNQGDGSPGLI